MRNASPFCPSLFHRTRAYRITPLSLFLSPIHSSFLLLQVGSGKHAWPLGTSPEEAQVQEGERTQGDDEEAESPSGRSEPSSGDLEAVARTVSSWMTGIPASPAQSNLPNAQDFFIHYGVSSIPRDIAFTLLARTACIWYPD